jgi:hypothetical protein
MVSRVFVADVVDAVDADADVIPPVGLVLVLVLVLSFFFWMLFG